MIQWRTPYIGLEFRFICIVIYEVQIASRRHSIASKRQHNIMRAVSRHTEWLIVIKTSKMLTSSICTIIGQFRILDTSHLRPTAQHIMSMITFIVHELLQGIILIQRGLEGKSPPWGPSEAGVERVQESEFLQHSHFVRLQSIFISCCIVVLVDLGKR